MADLKDKKVDEKISHANYSFQFISSFIVPLVGFILGAILLSKDDEEQKQVGKECIILGIFSCTIAIIITMLVI